MFGHSPVAFGGAGEAHRLFAFRPKFTHVQISAFRLLPHSQTPSYPAVNRWPDLIDLTEPEGGMMGAVKDFTTIENLL